MQVGVERLIGLVHFGDKSNNASCIELLLHLSDKCVAFAAPERPENVFKFFILFCLASL